MKTTQEKCFALTGTFEGGGYSTLIGNFDGAGMSFGFLQWNFYSGTLQPLLKAMHAAGPETFKKACTVFVKTFDKEVDLSGDLLRVCRAMTNAEAVAWISQRQDEGHRLLPHWTKLFKNLAAVPGFQAVQRQFAQTYWKLALNYMPKFGFKSERGLALLFDICVQAGSVTNGSLGRYAADPGSKGDEVARMAALARAVQFQDSRKWVQRDLLSRKMTIALGKGIVHGGSFNLETDFDITLRAVIA